MAWENVEIPDLHFSKFNGDYWFAGQHDFSEISDAYNIYGDFYQNSANTDEYHTLYTTTLISTQAFKYPYTWNNWKYGLRIFFTGHSELNINTSGSISPQDGGNYIYYFAQIDRTAEDVRMGFAYRPFDGNTNKIYLFTWLNGMSYANRHIIYQLLVNSIPPTYHWYSVSSISGNGKITSLSQIASASINGGEPVTSASASAFDSLVASSKLSALASGKTEETPIVYSDDENYLAIKDNGDNTCNLRFYLEGQSLLKIQNASQNAYLSILEDDTNQVVKPSIIYKSGNTYSYNTESPSLDTMENLYNWLHIQTRKKENKTGRWSTSFTFSRVEE